MANNEHNQEEKTSASNSNQVESGGHVIGNMGFERDRSFNVGNNNLPDLASFGTTNISPDMQLSFGENYLADENFMERVQAIDGISWKMVYRREANVSQDKNPNSFFISHPISAAQNISQDNESDVDFDDVVDVSNNGFPVKSAYSSNNGVVYPVDKLDMDSTLDKSQLHQFANLWKPVNRQGTINSTGSASSHFLSQVAKMAPPSQNALYDIFANSFSAGTEEGGNVNINIPNIIQSQLAQNDETISNQNRITATLPLKRKSSSNCSDNNAHAFVSVKTVVNKPFAPLKANTSLNRENSNDAPSMKKQKSKKKSSQTRQVDYDSDEDYQPEKEEFALTTSSMKKKHSSSSSAQKRSYFRKSKHSAEEIMEHEAEARLMKKDNNRRLAQISRNKKKEKMFQLEKENELLKKSMHGCDRCCKNYKNLCK